MSVLVFKRMLNDPETISFAANIMYSASTAFIDLDDVLVLEKVEALSGILNCDAPRATTFYGKETCPRENQFINIYNGMVTIRYHISLK
jgi:hypothetical protein